MEGKPKEIQDSQFTDEVINIGSPVLVDFWAPWCVPCRKQAPVLEKVAESVAGAARVAKVNVDADGELAARMGIQFIPTLIVFRDGAEVRRFTAVQDEAVLVGALREALNRDGKWKMENGE
jgi:thioredoxin 1